jgi:putative heme iron utilization protein
VTPGCIVIGGVILIVLAVIVITAWLYNSAKRSVPRGRRQQRIGEAQAQAEQEIQAMTQATLAAMRAAVREQFRSSR